MQTVAAVARVPKGAFSVETVDLGAPGAGEVMRSMACPAGSSLAVYGGGPVGLVAVMAAVIRGCRQIIVVKRLAARRRDRPARRGCRWRTPSLATLRCGTGDDASLSGAPWTSNTSLDRRNVAGRVVTAFRPPSKLCPTPRRLSARRCFACWYIRASPRHRPRLRHPTACARRTPPLARDAAVAAGTN